MLVNAAGVSPSQASNEALFPVLEKFGIGLVAFSLLANGLLSDCYDTTSYFDSATEYRAGMPQFQLDSYDKNHKLLQLICRIAGEKDMIPAQISLAWMLCKKPWIVPTPCTCKPD